MNKVKNIQIEGLRGICVLLVVLFHIYPRYYQLFFCSDIMWMNQWGTFGVYVFLLLSSFLMSKASDTGLQETGSATAYICVLCLFPHNREKYRTIPVIERLISNKNCVSNDVQER